MKKLPIGIQTFADLVNPKENFIYVDKTEVLYQLSQRGRYYFLSRPRRFGKSTMLTTLDALYSGRRDLFKDLYVEDKWDWDIIHPVISLTFGMGTFRTEKKFDQVILRILEDNQEKLHISCTNPKTDPDSCFHELIKKAYHQYQQKVVILIDEYDKPILDHITDKELARFNRDKLKGFYSIIKGMDEYIQFVMITGVSKFAKMNLFSGLNNLEDISIDKRYATICGYTHAEVEGQFQEYLPGVDTDKLQDWYNGYNYFGEPIYNPFDILLFFAKDNEYRPYWWSTGNPSFLIVILQQHSYYLPEVENYIADDILLDTFDVDHIDLIAILWQTGYLTFAKKFTKREKIVYQLKVPNKEIQLSLNELFIDYLTDQRHAKTAWQDKLYDSLEDADLNAFKHNLFSLFANIPYQNYANKIIAKYEGYYASVVFTYLASLGLPIIAEDTTNTGRIDLSIQFADKVYIIEFKVDQPGKAMKQIVEKRYHEKFLHSGKDIYLLGINFDSAEKNITDFEWQKVGV